MPKADKLHIKPLAALETEREAWGERLPGNEDDLWPWCLEQHQSVLLDLLAFCAACTVDAIIRKADRPESERIVHANALASAAGLDMTHWFTPTPANYFVSRDQIAKAHREAKGCDPAPALLKLKKGELAERIAQALDGTRWAARCAAPSGRG
ncbi:MAG: hypothetical protein ACRD1R_12150 [Acidobacteriota bacterium]